ncbi:MAG: glycerol-3-phosphate 1-O-acyltransferase [Nevskiaceae bacterium]|nr:MAG: glycerol-3-phosphate 1-O-acyltransferase [Nevskiaceae bacterium]TBR73548.1 MAG: glycerol-3-phosphate 1-O-acyltransferase [Nevskiaceae bacterium]
MLEAAVKCLVAYLVGGVMGGSVLRRMLGGRDLRSAGSGNLGATNALRTRGTGFALGVLAIDVGKGVFAALVVPHLPWPAGWALGSASLAPTSLAYACGVAVALGHCFPLFQHFRGGKGVATLAGVFASLLPAAFPWMLGIFLLVVLASGYVSLASLCGAAAAVVATAFAPGLATGAGAFALAMAALVGVRHTANIRRLATGTEPRFERLRVLGRWLSKRIETWRAR